ncbi:MAG: nucleotidyl transferase AbiEii/AbiGii toxin family protein [Bacteroidota bacterium]|jgi:predicted nucleotidyltransferase
MHGQLTVFDKLLAKIAKQLDAAQIPYMIVGGQAVLQYGEPRLTKDIDVTLGLGVDGLPKVLSLLRKLGLRCLLQSPKKFVEATYVLPAMDAESRVRVDFIFSDTSYERQSIKRSKVIVIRNQRVRFATLEDVIIQKVIAGRARDLEDVSNMLMKNPRANARYIKKWLGEFETALGIVLVRRFSMLITKKNT